MKGGDLMAANKAAVAVADETIAYRNRRADSTGQPEPGPHARDSLPAIIHRQARFAARSVSALSDDDSQTHYNSDDSRLLYAESKKRAAGSSGEGGHTQFEVESWPAEHRDSETEDEGDSIKLNCTSGLRASKHATSSCASMLAAGVSGKGDGKDGNDSRASNQSSATSSPILLPKVTIAQVPSLVQAAANTIATEIAVQEEPAVPEQKDEQKSPSNWNAARKKKSSAEVKSGEEMEGEGKESAVESAVVLAIRMDDETCKTQDTKQDEAQDAQGGPVFAVFSPSSMQVESQQAQDMESQQAQDIYKSLPVSGVDEGQKEEWKKETMPEPQPSPGRKSSPSLWRTEGSEYLGLDVLRAVTDNDGRVGEGWGSITGWLSADESDFTNDQGEAAELWHVVFDDTALGEEDLEEHEVKEAVLAGQAVLARSKKPKAAIRGGQGGRQVGGKGRGGSNGGRGKGKDKASQHKTLLNSQALVLQGSRYCPLKSDIGSEIEILCAGASDGSSEDTWKKAILLSQVRQQTFRIRFIADSKGKVFTIDCTEIDAPKKQRLEPSTRSKGAGDAGNVIPGSLRSSSCATALPAEFQAGSEGEFREMMKRLARYVELHGHACIHKKVGESGDQGFGCNTFVGLGKWCARQRSLNSAGNMSVERQQRLNALDFEWDGKRIGGRSGVVKSYTKKRKNADLPTPMNSSQFAAAVAVAAASLLTVEDSKALPSASLAEAGNSMTGISVIHDESDEDDFAPLPNLSLLAMKANTHVLQNKHPSLRILKEGGEEVGGRAPSSSNMYNSKTKAASLNAVESDLLIEMTMDDPLFADFCLVAIQAASSATKQKETDDDDKVATQVVDLTAKWWHQLPSSSASTGISSIRGAGELEQNSLLYEMAQGDLEDMASWLCDPGYQQYCQYVEQELALRFYPNH